MKIFMVCSIALSQFLSVWTIPQLYTWRIPQTDDFTRIEDVTSHLYTLDDIPYYSTVDRILPNPNFSPADLRMLTGFFIVIGVTAMVAMTGFVVSNLRGGSGVSINVGKSIVQQSLKISKSLIVILLLIMKIYDRKFVIDL